MMDLLPDELVVLILNELSVSNLPSDERWMWNLSRVDKRFHRLSEARLYERFHSADEYSALFLRTLSSSRRLASHVKSITWASSPHCMRSQYDDALSPGEKSLIATQLRHLQTVAADRLAVRFEHISIADNDAYLSTVLLLTPRIEELTINHTHTWARTHTWLTLAMAHPLQLGTLKKVTLCGMVEVKNLQALFTLPSLRTLEVTRKLHIRPYHELRPQFQQWDTADEKLIPAHPYSSQIEHLHLTSDQACGLDFPSWEEKVRSLKSFSLRCKTSPKEVDRQAYYDMASFLARQSRTLEFVSLKDAWLCPALDGTSIFQYLSNAEGLRYIDFNPVDFLPSFQNSRPRNYPKSFPLYNMLQGLPAGLERLALCPNDQAHFGFGGIIEGFADALETLAPSIKTFLPALKEIAIINWHPFVGIFPCQTDMTMLQEAFAKEEVFFISTPRIDVHMNEDIYSLEYVEEDWIWVQPYRMIGESWKWTKMPTLHRPQVIDYLTIRVADLKDEDLDTEAWDVWVHVYVVDHIMGNRYCEASEMVMDQYMVEQPAWYWEKLQSRRQTTGSKLRTEMIDVQ